MVEQGEVRAVVGLLRCGYGFTVRVASPTNLLGVSLSHRLVGLAHEAGNGQQKKDLSNTEWQFGIFQSPFCGLESVA